MAVAEDRRLQREGGLVGRLRIDDRRGVHGAGAHRDLQSSPDLRAGQHRMDILGRAEGRRSRAHVDVGSEAAHDAGRARANQLAQRDDGERLRRLLHQRAASVTGAIAPISVKGVMTTHCPWRAIIMMLSRISSSTRRGELTFVTVMQRRARDASSSTEQPCSIADSAIASSACTPPTPRAAQTMSAHSICAWYIARWRTATGTSTGSTTIRPASAVCRSAWVELEDVAKRLQVAVAPPALEVADVGRAVDRPEIDDVYVT